MLLRDASRRSSDERRPSHGTSSTSPLQGAAALATQSRYARRGVPAANDTIRVVLVDDHMIVRDGLRALLRSAPDIQVVGEASSGHEAIGVVQRCAPDVVLMDLDMPDGDRTTASVELARLDPAPRVLILTMHTEEERLVPLLEAGARGFLSKDAQKRISSTPFASSHRASSTCVRPLRRFSRPTRCRICHTRTSRRSTARARSSRL